MNVLKQPRDVLRIILGLFPSIHQERIPSELQILLIMPTIILDGGYQIIVMSVGSFIDYDKQPFGQIGLMPNNHFFE
jgi:hypothetical protein